MFSDSRKEKNAPQNLTTKTIVKKFKIKDQIISVTVKDVLFGQINGHELMLDESSVNAMLVDIIGAATSNSTKYNPIPKSIILSHSEDQKKTNHKTEHDTMYCFEPRWNMDDVYVDEEQKAQILSAVAIVEHKNKLFKEWGLEETLKTGRSMVLNFYGPPGTGKSMMAEAVAKDLGKSVCLVNYAQLESKYVGETPKNITNSFLSAKENNAVLIFDEADSLLGERLTNISQSADYGVNLTRSVMLMELEQYDGVVIFTTNLISNYDDAFKRRILANVEFKLPDENGRLKIWSNHIPSKLPLHEVSFEQLSLKYRNISGADIKDIILMASVLAIQSNREYINISDFDQAYKFVTSRYLGSESNINVTHEKISEEQYQKEIATDIER